MHRIVHYIFVRNPEALVASMKQISRPQFKAKMSPSTSSLVIGALLLVNWPLFVQASGPPHKTAVQRVLLISVDGLHALDLANYVKDKPHSAFAELSGRGVTYTNARSSMPSNSWPGLLAIVTGGSPISTGVIFENSYDRSLSPPGSNCTAVGTPTIYGSSIDNNPDAPQGGAINPRSLPLDPAKGCTPVYPHSFVRVNNVFEEIKKHGGRTAWSDKHPAYEFLNGPSGTGIDDLYTPEITAPSGVATTNSFAMTMAYDDLKVAAIVNEIRGFDHAGTAQVGVPTVLGQNF